MANDQDELNDLTKLLDDLTTLRAITSTMHTHRCANCGHEWEHTAASLGSLQDHTCESCGRVQWRKWDSARKAEIPGTCGFC